MKEQTYLAPQVWLSKEKKLTLQNALDELVRNIDLLNHNLSTTT